MSTAEAWTVGRLLTWTADYLKKHGSSSPRLDAEVLLAEARGCQRIELYTSFTEEPSEEVRASFKEMVRRRAEGTPVAYLVGRKEFYSLAFEVNPDVLIPRPETEHLVVEAIDRAKKLAGQAPGRESIADISSPVHSTSKAEPRASPVSQVDVDTASHVAAAGPGQSSEVIEAPSATASATASAAAPGEPSGAGEWVLRPKPLLKSSFNGLTIADVGTGSGIIAIALARSLPGVKVIALDISRSALALASRNVEKHGLSAQIQLIESDLLAAASTVQFDIIASNPPYVTEAEYAALPTSVRSFEPRGALVGGPSGTETIERLLEQAAQRLKPGGWLLFEISPMIADKVLALLDRSRWTEPTITKDLSGHARVVAVSRL